jgi:hypothetical protein
MAGERASAVQWKRVAIDRGFVNYPFLARHDPSFETLRGDSAFTELLEVARHRWERFEACESSMGVEVSATHCREADFLNRHEYYRIEVLKD